MRALVTGANRGLGFETAKQLLAKGYEVIVTARTPPDAEASAQQLGTPDFLQLDVGDAESIQRAVRSLSDAGQPLDVVVNNAGVSLDGFNRDVAERTLRVNAWGALQLTDALRSAGLLRSTGHTQPQCNVVMVSSAMGELHRFSAALKQRFLAEGLTRAELSTLADEFLQAIELGQVEAAGFPRNAYSVSKALLNGLTRVLTKEWGHDGPRVNAVCPGWVRTRMGGQGAPRAPEQGARGIVWAATLDRDGPRGGFFRDGQAIEW